MTDGDPIRRWSVVAVGALLLAVAVGYAHSDGDPLAVGSAEAALPVACGLGLVICGYRLRHAHDQYDDDDIAIAALGGLLGSAALTLLVSWILVVQTLDGDSLVEPAYTLLNGAAIGTGVGTGFAVGYVRIRREQRTVEQQNERLERLSEVLSHDLRNPLNVALGHAELAREAERLGEAEQLRGDEPASDGGDTSRIARVIEALERMDALIDDSLALARQTRATVERERLHLSVVAESSWRTVETGESDLVVEATGVVRADEAMLRQVFENLFRNAVEHNDGPVTITVGSLADGYYVADDGVGFDGTDPERLFDPGFTTEDDGTGLGLDIVRTVADRHGWTVEAVSASGGGARFEFTGVESATD